MNRLSDLIRTCFVKLNALVFIDYPADFLTLDQLGREFLPYRPTFHFKTQYINDNHQFYRTCPTEGELIQVGIKGFLRAADALKLYELAYYCSGNILEMGSAWGLSTSILCQAVADSGRAAQVISLEIDPTFHQQTVQQIAQLHLTPYLQAHQCDASEFSSILIEKKQSFGLAFIDHCHSYQATGIACQQLRKLMAPNGFVLFHDFNDERNRLDFPTFGVYQGVIENFAENDFIFSGLFGCTALYRKRGQLKFK